MRRALALLMLGCGCLPPPEPPGLDAEKVRSVSASGVTLEGATLSSSCQQTGVERCFDATDNDCNGLVDEGCGLPDGDVALLAAWSDNPAQIDWVLYLPGGKKVDRAVKKAGAFKYAKDCPEQCFGQNVDAVVASEGAPVKGTYRAELRLRSATGAELPVQVHVAARFGTRVEEADVTLDLDHELRVLTFSL